MDNVPKTRPSLLVRIRDPRNEQAWTEFLEIYEPLVYRLARKKGFQDADALELTQDVFLAVASAIERWDPDPAKGSFRGWLFRISRNLMINFLAQKRRRTSGSGDSDVKRLLDEYPAPNGQQSALFDREYKRQTFRWAAERIRGHFEDKTWQAFWLTSVEGKPIQQAAQALGISTGAVYVARSRVMSRLRKTVQQLEDHD
jgi:RNA polymerase sigma factor (sigma-70 family)